MKRVALTAAIFVASLQASQLHTLLHALKNKPVTQIDIAAQKIAKLSKQKVTDQFYPSFALFGTYEHYTNDTNLRPVPPPEANRRISEHQPLPFAQNIQRVGISGSMPLFVKSLFTLKKKLAYIYEAAKLKKKLNFYKNEAIIVGAYANLLALHETKNALFARKRSLLKMRQDIKIAVDSGRAAPIALDKIDTSLANLAISLQDLNIKESLAKERISALTGIEVKNIEPIEQIGSLKEGELFAIKPLAKNLKAAQKDISIAKESFFPKLLLEGKWSKNYAQKDVLYGEDVDVGYGDVTLKLVIPLSKAQFTDIDLAKAKYFKEHNRFLQTRQELEAQAKSLHTQLSSLKIAIEASQKKVASQKELVKYAKTAYKVGRLSEEEYLRYEEGLFFAQANLAQLKAQKWQTLAQLAVIYGNDLERIVK
ncbi:TolC family protein [Nitratiruptor sp. YY09-18]|uniref:TolC family protein n=1 Tax=Nitratiruptor sp. YY09-18 TaxID=2724901 RepID=UPI001916276E|nr:TolC family protein [Nitratiruptor sp. YY09-18]BCD67249.1 hypothetical protein NitYY0918_C0120 [Nitratiruptor sp. YY09-18]